MSKNFLLSHYWSDHFPDHPIAYRLVFAYGELIQVGYIAPYFQKIAGQFHFDRPVFMITCFVAAFVFVYDVYDFYR